MSIHEVAVKCAAYLARELGSDSRDELRMAYGLEILLGELVKFACMLLLAWILGILPEVLIMGVAAAVLRLASGGEHCSEYYRCFIGGTLCFLFLGGGVHWLNPLLERMGLYVIAGASLLVSAFIMWRYAPGETANKPIKSEEDRIKLKRVSLAIALAYGVFMLISVNITFLQPAVLPLAVGMIEQAFTVSPRGYRFMHFIDQMLNFDKRSEEGYDSQSADS